MKGLVFSTVTGGLINGSAAAIQGNNFLNGRAPLPTQQSVAPRVSNATSTKQTEGSHSVYEGKNPATGKTEYIGRTKRGEARFMEHNRSKTLNAELDYNFVKKGMSLKDARVFEQQLINKHGLHNLNNRINSIAPGKWHLHNQLKHHVPNSKY